MSLAVVICRLGRPAFIAGTDYRLGFGRLHSVIVVPADHLKPGCRIFPGSTPIRPIDMYPDLHNAFRSILNPEITWIESIDDRHYPYRAHIEPTQGYNIDPGRIAWLVWGQLSNGALPVSSIWVGQLGPKQAIIKLRHRFGCRTVRWNLN